MKKLKQKSKDIFNTMTKISAKQLQKMIREIITEQVEEGLFLEPKAQSPETLKLAHRAYMQVYQASEGFKKVGEITKDKEIANVSKMLADFVSGKLTQLIKQKGLMPQ